MGTQTHTHERCRGHRSTITPLVRASRHAMYRPPLSPRAALHARLAADLPPCRRQTHAPDGGVPPTHTFGTEPVVPRRITCGLLGAAEHVEQERLSGHSLLEEARTTHLLVCAGAPSLRTGTTISLCVVVAIAWSRLWRGVSSRVTSGPDLQTGATLRQPFRSHGQPVLVYGPRGSAPARGGRTATAIRATAAAARGRAGEAPRSNLCPYPPSCPAQRRPSC